MLGPDPETEFPTCEMDMRTGGTFRWVRVDAAGELEISGDVLEAEAPHRHDRADGWQCDGGMEFAPTTNTSTLTEHDGVTTLRTVTVYNSKESRDGAYASGMDVGIDAGYERMASHWG